MLDKAKDLLINTLIVLAFVGFLFFLDAVTLSTEESAKEECSYKNTGEWVSDEEYQQCIDDYIESYEYRDTTHLQ